MGICSIFLNRDFDIPVIDRDATVDDVDRHEELDDGEDEIFITQSYPDVDEEIEEEHEMFNECEYMDDIYTEEGLDPNLEGYQSDEVSNIEGVDGEKEINAHSRLSHANRGIPFDGHEELAVGMTFASVEDFRNALRDYRVKAGFHMKQKFNDLRRFSGTCSTEGCPWMIYASRMQGVGGFKIRSYCGDHTCQRKFKNSSATSTWVAEKFRDVIRADPKITNDSLRALIQRMFYVDVPDHTLWRAKRITLYGTKGEHTRAYKHLRQYAKVVGETNSGSMCVIQKIQPMPEEPPIFKRMFLSFCAQKEGFLNGCRSFIGVDGCHLRGTYGRILLSAVTLDANSSIFPIAVAVVEAENKEAWAWFFRCIRLYFGEGNPHPWTIMSDRQKGIIAAIQQELSYAHIRFCARHILANIKNEVKVGTIPRGLYWKAVRASNDVDYKRALEDIKKINPLMFHYLKEIPTENWARFAFHFYAKSDHVTNNMTESWNASLGTLRGGPILDLFEGIRKKVMVMIALRKQESQQCITFAPQNTVARVEKATTEARKIKDKYWGGDRRYEVYVNGRKYITDLEKCTCDCGDWQISGFPCAHVIRCIVENRGEVAAQLLDEKLKSESFRRTYARLIMPIPDPVHWEESALEVLNPPPLKKQPGWPKGGKRRKEPGSPQQKKMRGSLKYSLCQQFGHNRKGCSQNPSSATARKRSQLNTQASQVRICVLLIWPLWFLLKR